VPATDETHLEGSLDNKARSMLEGG
jgi:hypothetical protein